MLPNSAVGLVTFSVHANHNARAPHVNTCVLLARLLGFVSLPLSVPFRAAALVGFFQKVEEAGEKKREKEKKLAMVEGRETDPLVARVVENDVVNIGAVSTSKVFTARAMAGAVAGLLMVGTVTRRRRQHTASRSMYVVFLFFYILSAPCSARKKNKQVQKKEDKKVPPHLRSR